MVRYLFYTIGDLTYQSPLVIYKDYISQTHLIYFSCLSLHGRHISTSSRSSSDPNLVIQDSHKLAYKMQDGIPVADNVCEVKLDKINHWICVHREDLSVAMVY